MSFGRAEFSGTVGERRWPVPGLAALADPRRDTPTLSEDGRGQLQFELLASIKLFTELTTLAASLATVAISVVEGLDGSAPSELLSASTEEVIALVWVGKSLLAELVTAVASLWIVSTWDFRLLKSPLVTELVSPLTESCRLARSVQ